MPPAPLEAWSSEETSGLRRVLIPLDGWPAAEAIIPFVSRIARPIVIDNTGRLRQEADDYLRAIADRLSANGLRVLTAVRVGDAATEALSGARVRGGLGRHGDPW